MGYFQDIWNRLRERRRPTPRPRPRPPQPRPEPVRPSPTRPEPAEPAQSLMAPANWTIGPIIGGANQSRGMPRNPSPHLEGWAVTLPPQGGKLGAITTRTVGSLAGKREMILKYRIAGTGSVHPVTGPTFPPLLSLFFQRRGDNWSARGSYETFRWYSPLYHMGLKPGDYELRVPLDANWTAILTSSAEKNPSAFEAAKRDTDNVGMVFGGGDGRAHGVFARGHVEFICLSFEVV